MALGSTVFYIGRRLSRSPTAPLESRPGRRVARRSFTMKFKSCLEAPLQARPAVLFIGQAGKRMKSFVAAGLAVLNGKDKVVRDS